MPVAPASGIDLFGDVLRIQAWVCLRRLALASGIRFRLWASGLHVRESSAKAGMRDSMDRAAFGKAGRKAEVL